MKKIINILGFILLLGLLVWGGVIRTRSVMGSNDSLALPGPGVSITSGKEATAPLAETANAIASGDWSVMEGVVQAWDSKSLSILIDSGMLIAIEGRGLRYLTENSFQVDPGERVSLSGFYEGSEFEVGMITNLTTGLSIRLRGEDGRPVWGSGGGGQ